MSLSHLELSKLAAVIQSRPGDLPGLVIVMADAEVNRKTSVLKVNIEKTDEVFVQSEYPSPGFSQGNGSIVGWQRFDRTFGQDTQCLCEADKHAGVDQRMRLRTALVSQRL